ncbi:MAG: hypothetical protein JWM64_1765 [Frankiales bacterium]|nr:hypothetical protein [Frankiales bacterium]
MDARLIPLSARPLEPTPGPPPLDPATPVPDDPGELDDPDLLPPAPVEPGVPLPAEPEPEPV